MDLIKKAELDQQTLKEIRKLHFQTRRLADQSMTGSYRSAFRGRGIEFEEVREYIPGDDVRSIDWKVTARYGRPYVKSYREERELTVMIAVDVSASTLTGTRNQLRDDLIAKVGAVLALIALSNNDKVGLVTFSDRLETYHPPRKARGAVWRILHEVLVPGVYRPQTDLAGLFSFLSNVLKKRAVVFVLSDFLGQDFETPMASLAKRHDLTAILASDPVDFELPQSGLVNLRDPETGQVVLLDTSCEATRELYRKATWLVHEKLLVLFRKHAVGVIELQTDEPFVPELRRYFKEKRTVRC
jgi:uncharacterized protein (DUF58 family)